MIIQALIIEGSGVEIYPSSMTLPGGCEHAQFVLVNIPHETGIVTVLGKGSEYRVLGFRVHSPS